LRKVAVVSDVHANLEALEAFLAEMRGERIYCLGDIVGYGASPNEVIELLREKKAISLLGNHDQAALTGDTSNFNSRAAISARWTMKALSPENRKYLQGLPQELKVEVDDSTMYLTHGSPDDHLWEYVDPSTHSELFGFYLKKLSADLIALGHTHVPYLWKGESGIVFNPGSIGQPRSGDNRAAYAMLSVESRVATVELKQVPYDIRKAADRILTAGLPREHAERLFAGI